MKILLDTHILIWYIRKNEQMPSKAKALIEDENNEIFFSVLNIWEIYLKSALNKELITKNICNFTADLIENGFEPLPLTPRNLYQLENIVQTSKEIHKDPFDNCLLAQAKSSGSYLLTHDHCFKNYKDENIILV